MSKERARARLRGERIRRKEKRSTGVKAPQYGRPKPLTNPQAPKNH